MEILFDNLSYLERIKLIRLKKGFSQEFMAYKLGVSQKTYSNMENGKTLINDEAKKKISEILGIKPHIICPLCDSCK